MKKALGLTLLCLFACGPAFGGGFSLKVTGGLGLVGGGNYNDIVDGQNQYYHSFPLVNVIEELDQLRWGLNFGAEVIYHFSDRLGLGLGVGYLRASDESTMEARLFTSPLFVTYHPSVSSVPLTLSLHYFLPLSSGLNLHLFGGPGLYLTSVKLDRLASFPSELTQQADSFEPDGKAVLGFEGGLGLEVGLGRGVFLVADIKGRALTVSNLHGHLAESFDIGALHLSGQRNATMWYVEEQVYGAYYASIEYDTLEPDEADMRNVEEASFGLSGFSFLVGIRVRL